MNFRIYKTFPIVLVVRSRAHTHIRRIIVFKLKNEKNCFFNSIGFGAVTLNFSDFYPIRGVRHGTTEITIMHVKNV